MQAISRYGSFHAATAVLITPRSQGEILLAKQHTFLSGYAACSLPLCLQRHITELQDQNVGLETQTARLAEDLQRRTVHLQSLDQQVLQLRTRKQAQQDLLRKLSAEEAWSRDIISSVQVSSAENSTLSRQCHNKLHL